MERGLDKFTMNDAQCIQAILMRFQSRFSQDDVDFFETEMGHSPIIEDLHDYNQSTVISSQIIRQYLKFAELVHFFRLLPRLVFVVSCRGSVKRDIRLAVSGHILSKLRSCAIRSEKDTQ